MASVLITGSSQGIGLETALEWHFPQVGGGETRIPMHVPARGRGFRPF